MKKTRKNNSKGKYTKNKRVKYGGFNRTKKFKKINCSPKPKGKLNDFTCYSNEALIELRDHWNARHPDVKITTNSPKEIHKITAKLIIKNHPILLFFSLFISHLYFCSFCQKECRNYQISIYLILDNF
jgi:hypothetical protein